MATSRYPRLPSHKLRKYVAKFRHSSHRLTGERGWRTTAAEGACRNEWRHAPKLIERVAKDFGATMRQLVKDYSALNELEL